MVGARVSGRQAGLGTGERNDDHREQVMQLAITAIAVIGGLVFSLAIAVLMEELIFGEIFRLFFAQRAVARIRSGQNERR